MDGSDIGNVLAGGSNGIILKLDTERMFWTPIDTRNLNTTFIGIWVGDEFSVAIGNK